MRVIKNSVLFFLVLAMAMSVAFPAFADASPQPTATPDPAATAAAAPNGQVLEGTVMYITADDIMVKMENGNVFNFYMQGVGESDIKIGDQVAVTYTGDILNCPVATDVAITKADPVSTVSGTVIEHDSTSIFVQINSSDVLGFTLTKDTVVLGLGTEVLNGDKVNVTYDGNILDGPPATQIIITEVPASYVDPGDGKPMEDTTNKSLNGVVTALSKSKITIQTSRKHKYTFRIVKNTRIDDRKIDLEVGCRVRIVYDGYASKNPDAKNIKVTSAPDPTPKPTKKPVVYQTVTGRVSSFGGMMLSLTNGYSFDVAYAKIGGDGKRVEGEKAKVTFYEKKGELYATKIIFYKNK